MNIRRKSWGFIRWIYLIAGLIAAIAAPLAFVSPDAMSINPFLATAIALLVLVVPLMASDELLQRVHRIFWWRKWPK